METANTSNFSYPSIPSRKSLFAAARQFCNHVRAFALVATVATLIACSDGQAPSQLTGNMSQGTSSSSASSAAERPSFATDQTIDAPADVLRVSVTPLAYSDQSLIASLRGELHSNDGIEVPYLEWVQTSGPEAHVVNPRQPNTDILLPGVASPTWLTFTLFAMTEDAQLASDSVSLRVLPTSQSLLTVSSSNVSTQQLDVTVSLHADAEEPVTFRYSTTDGTALGDVDFTPISGELTLGPDARTGTLTIDLVDFRDAPRTDNLYFALNFHSDGAGQQRVYLVIPANDEEPTPTKPIVHGPVTMPSEALAGGAREQMTAVAVYGLPHAPGELIITNPCQQTFTIREPADDCENSEGLFSHGINNTLPYERASWSTAAEGAYQFAIVNPTEYTISYNLYVFWGESSEHLSGDIPPGQTVDVRELLVTEDVLAYQPPGSSSSSSASSSSQPSLEEFVSPCDSWEGGCSSLQTPSNPYEGTDLYIDPDFQQSIQQYQATAPASWENALTRVAQAPTAIWIDKTGMILHGDAATERRSLAEHLLLASQQQFDGEEPSAMTVQLVLRNETATQVDETVPSEEIEVWIENYINETLVPLQQLAEQFSNLRLIIVVEPNLVPELIKTNTKLGSLPLLTPLQKSVGNRMVREAVQHLSDITTHNTYLYLGMGHAAWLPSSVNSIPQWLATNIIVEDDINLRGFATNVGGYIPTEETLLLDEFPHNLLHVDEYSYISAIRNAFDNAEINNDYSFIIDTSRSGWGGPGRPTLAGGVHSLLDTRQHRDNWCNIKNAGLGEFPRTAPHSDLLYLDAITWLKQPGYSDGNSQTVGTEASSADACDPINNDSLAEAPAGGTWFTSFFESLVKNAWPPLLEESSVNAAPFSTLSFELTSHDIYSDDTSVLLEGTIAEGAAVQQIQIFADGRLLDLSDSSLELSENRFSINVNALDLPEQQVELNSQQMVDATAYELRILVRDTQDAWFEDTVFYASAYYAAGTEGQDAVYYSSATNWLTATGDGDDLLLPLDIEARPPEVRAGGGNDRIYATAGNFHGGEGDDIFRVVDSTSYRETFLEGEAGDDHYIFQPSSTGDRRYTILEQNDPTGGFDTLTLLNITPADVQNVFGQTSAGVVEELVITLTNGDRLTIPNFTVEPWNPLLLPATSIERVLFDDGSAWEIEELLERAINPPT